VVAASLSSEAADKLDIVQWSGVRYSRFDFDQLFAGASQVAFSSWAELSQCI